MEGRSSSLRFRPKWVRVSAKGLLGPLPQPLFTQSSPVFGGAFAVLSASACTSEDHFREAQEVGPGLRVDVGNEIILSGRPKDNGPALLGRPWLVVLSGSREERTSSRFGVSGAVLLLERRPVPGTGGDTPSAHEVVRQIWVRQDRRQDKNDLKRISNYITHFGSVVGEQPWASAVAVRPVQQQHQTQVPFWPQLQETEFWPQTGQPQQWSTPRSPLVD